ncbi:CinA-like protein [Rickettsiales bacterium Ac37b]|nr:CinA-like protein [Rickettsiales bacterium Ac37b]
MTNITAAIIIIGNEILSGNTIDANTSFLAVHLNKLGIKVMEVRIIPDIHEEIVRHINEIRSKYNYIFTTGGIGPTHDDITALAIAKAFGVELELNEEALVYLKEIYDEWELTPPRLKMAYIPEGASLIPNVISKAPGFIIENVYVMAGIPKIMYAMFEAIKDDLMHGKEILSTTITVIVGESIIAEKLSSIQDMYPDVEIGSYPINTDNKWVTNIVLRATDANKLTHVSNKLRTLLDDFL